VYSTRRPCAPFVPRGHELAARPSVSLAEIVAHTLVLNPPRTRTGLATPFIASNGTAVEAGLVMREPSALGPTFVGPATRSAIISLIYIAAEARPAPSSRSRARKELRQRTLQVQPQPAATHPAVGEFVGTWSQRGVDGESSRGNRLDLNFSEGFSVGWGP